MVADDRDQQRAGSAEDEEQIVRGLAEAVADAFSGYLHGELEFDEVTFTVFDTLQALHAVVAGEYTVEVVEEESPAAERGDTRRRK